MSKVRGAVTGMGTKVQKGFRNDDINKVILLNEC